MNRSPAVSRKVDKPVRASGIPRRSPRRNVSWSNSPASRGLVHANPSASATTCPMIPPSAYTSAVRSQVNSSTRPSSKPPTVEINDTVANRANRSSACSSDNDSITPTPGAVQPSVMSTSV